ncbi:MAG TPA: DNA methyltransferase, partial [Planctomycetota bacterium]|nr:DNA methyltransferase [Planctomycetota bacterium]
KPTEIFAIPMRVHTKPGDLCYEPFAGSGSQIIAAERTGRRCYAIEIEPIFVDVAVRRWEEFTGQKATRETTCAKQEKAGGPAARKGSGPAARKAGK